MSIVTVENVTHMYGDKINFHNISFRLLRGEHVGLVGGNGAGKSTLLKLLTGELLPDEGKIAWFPQVRAGYLQQHIELHAGTTMLQYLQGAFCNLIEIEKKMDKAAEQMATAQENIDRLLQQYGEWQSILDQSDFYQMEAKIEEVAAGLGMLEIGLERDVGNLSGGQRTKLLLAKLLLEKPDVLLLDEPTNYLDDVHIEWLIRYLQNYQHAYIVVSHDERLLKEVTTVIYHLENQRLKRYNTNYETFLKNYEQSRQQHLLAYENQQKEIDKLENFIAKNRIRKAKQAKSREKVLQRIERIEKPTSVHQPRFSFHVHHNPESRIIVAKSIEIGYTEPLFAPLNVQVERGEKIAITGYNGIGKTTLLKTLIGQLTPVSGMVKVADHVKIAYFAQEDVPLEETPLKHLLSLHPGLTQKQIRHALAMCGIMDEYIRQPIHTLSGGEQAKVRLCELMLEESNMLVLDEPTNHLDVQAKEGLKEALQKYRGTILIVSHEPDFYEDWITKVWTVEDWRKN
ncbi:ABC-F family ATP-binding cassette domain-containing protein [Bacillaceae bacterium Marseille-Q3522]|nr:ABC-F family ATP-binding cassette domain-containing protein [Bacillaceae bacterium Marseille-Q3522]